MTKKILMLVVFQCCLLPAVQAQADTVLNRYREYLFRTAQPEENTIKTWMDSLDEKGQWPDINYEDKAPAGWKVSKHLERLSDLSLAWAHPQSSRYHDKELWETIGIALDHWLEKRYRNSNWWHNQIGVPRLMRDIIILVRSHLDEQRLGQALQVLAQHRVQGSGAGANLIWSADLGLHYGMLAGDEPLVKKCRDLIVNEIMIHTGEGIQPDYSFHQHSKRLQMYQYGKAFLLETLRIAWQLRETPLAFPEEKVNILTRFALEGWQWMARGINTVPGTMDRSSSRKGEMRSPDLRPLIPFFIELQPEKATAFKKMAAVQNGRASLEGYRYYPYSDFAAYHRPNFSFFLKTISPRTLSTESFNGENLKGKLLNSGDAYLISNGNEYFDLMPVWNWKALPGITGFMDAHKIDRQAFTGSVSDGESGLSAMDYVLTDQSLEQVLSAHKFWACHNDAVICLISNLAGENITGEVYTAMDQCRWQGDVTVNKPGNTLPSGQHELKDVKWIHHTNFMYIPIHFYDASVSVDLKPVTGSWKSINVSETGIPVKEKVFMPMLHHGQGLKGISEGYVLAYAPTPEHAAKIAAKPPWHVLRNSKHCQAVRFDDGTVMAAFFSPSQLPHSKITLEVNKPCLILIKEEKMFISDPTHAGGKVRVKWNNKAMEIIMPPNGATLEVNGEEAP